MWTKYLQNADDTEWDSESIDTFFKDLGVNSESDIVTLQISKAMSAKTMGEY